jgi:hypothetical protein
MHKESCYCAGGFTDLKILRLNIQDEFKIYKMDSFSLREQIT